MVNYFSFALKNSKKRGLRSWLTLLGIFIGIATVISLITLGSGLKAAVNAQFGVSSTQVITVQAGGLSLGPPGSAVVNPLTKQDAVAIGKLSSVEISSPRNMRSVKFEYNEKVSFGMAISVEEGLEDGMYETMDLKAEKGRLLKGSERRKVVLGSNYEDASRNGFDKEITLGKNILIQDKEFKVIGILEKKGSFLLENIAMLYDDDLEELIGYGDDVDIIGVKVKSRDLMNKTKEDIEKLLRQRRGVDKGEEDFEVSTPDAILGQVNSVLNAIQIFIIIIASISIIVGVIGIVNTMTTSVLERKKEIGIMKAIGAKNKHIFLQFFVESGLMGLIGGILGVIFGMIIGYVGILGINSFVGSTASPRFNIPLIVFSLLGSFIIGAAAGIIPAMSAAKQNPVEALRG